MSPCVCLSVGSIYVLLSMMECEERERERKGEEAFAEMRIEFGIQYSLFLFDLFFLPQFWLKTGMGDACPEF